MSRRKIKKGEKMKPPRELNALDKLHRNGVLTGYALAVKDIRIFSESVIGDHIGPEEKKMVAQILGPLLEFMAQKVNGSNRR